MKKIVNIERRPIIVDTETSEVKAINRSCRGIDDIYIVPEDARIEWTSRFPTDNVVRTDVKKDDIIVVFYDKDLGTDFVIIKSEDWLKALNNAARIEQERKEKWALEKKESVNSCESCGDACCESL